MALVIKFFRYRTGHFVAGLLVAATLLPGCKKSGLFTEAGAVKSTVIPLKSFDEIVLNDKINLILTYDSVNSSVTLEAGENLIRNIDVDVVGRKLIVHDNNSYKWSRDLDYTINLYVAGNALKQLTYYGAGNVRCTNSLIADEFIVDSWTGIGSIDLQLESVTTQLIIRMANADITVKGKSKSTTIYCADQGSMNLKNFESEEIHLDYRSVRNSTVNATRLLDAHILYKGDVFYRGTPVISAVYANSGKLLPLP